MSNTSGTSNWVPTIADLIIECFERIQVPPSALTPDNIISARRSANLILRRWANRGVNLWAVDLISIPMIQGVANYELPTNTVNMLDTYIRMYQLGTPVSIPVKFSTTIGSASVEIQWPNHGLSVGEYLQVQVPVSVGGIVLQGFYPVVSVPNSNNVTVVAGIATGTVSLGGAVPVFTTTTNSTTVTVVLNNHGLLSGQPFNVQVPLDIGGIVVQGSYSVSSVIDANTFTIPSPSPAVTGQTLPENGGQAYMAGQVQNTQPTDILLYPLSRNDYAAIPNKFTQGRPTTYWFDRTLSPNVTMWQVPNATQPYELRIYRMRSLQDANPVSGQTLDMVDRFYEAFCSALTAALAEKWRPEQYQIKEAKAGATWLEAADEDREKVPTYMTPDFSGYF